MDRRPPAILLFVLHGCSFDSGPEGTSAGTSTGDLEGSSGAVTTTAAATTEVASTSTGAASTSTGATTSAESTSTDPTSGDTSSSSEAGSETGAACGDGDLDRGEECDDANQADGDGCDMDCIKEARRVFVTSSLYPGNLGGLDGADSICQTHARQAGFSGVFLAWLSTDDSSPSARFIKSSVPYQMVDGTTIAMDWADLVDGSLESAVYLTETSETAPQGVHPCMPTDSIVVWTGTASDGTSSGTTCSNWEGSGDASWGRSSDMGESWTAYCSGPCAAASTPLLCFEQ